MLFENYLHNRKQRVVLNGSFSDYSVIESGVPQGSVLGPLLFLIYINDLEKSIKYSIKFFADDTMFFSIVKDPVLSADDLNHDLDIIYQWAHQWKMEFNPDPTKQATEVLFSCKKTSPSHPQLIFNGTIVKKVSEQKHLGLILDSGLTFKKHNEKTRKARIFHQERKMYFGNYSTEGNLKLFSQRFCMAPSICRVDDDGKLL